MEAQRRPEGGILLLKVEGYASACPDARKRVSPGFIPRLGSRRGSEHALVMNRYDRKLVRDRQNWRFKRMTIKNAWAQGDPEIINALVRLRVDLKTEAAEMRSKAL